MTQIEENPIEEMKEFSKNNPLIEIKYDPEKRQLILEGPWKNYQNKFILNIDEKESNVDLNKLIINPRFDAIFHIDNNYIEFFYGFIDPKESIEVDQIDRKFEFYLHGKKYSCYFGEPTKRMLYLAKCFQPSPSMGRDIPFSQVEMFKDFQELDRLPSEIGEYFTGKIPRNFFICDIDTKLEENEFVKIFRNLNFILRYYDRSSPFIVIREKEEKKEEEFPLPKRYLEENFPNQISIREVDEFLLQLIEVARFTNPRFAFVYYYQVIEYAAFYYLDSKARKELRQLLRNPTIINCNEEELSQIFALMCELRENDDVRMRRVIEEYCDPSIIWKEIENDKAFYSSEIVFDGGLVLSPLVAMDTTEETWKTMWMPKLLDYFTKIRNCIAHAREKRQSTVILASEKNTTLISRILPIIQRTAETIAIVKE